MTEMHLSLFKKKTNKHESQYTQEEKKLQKKLPLVTSGESRGTNELF